MIAPPSICPVNGCCGVCACTTAAKDKPASIGSRQRISGIEVIERDIPREYLYLCDELFMCGTAAEITPIRSVDGRQVGAGHAGPVTRRIQELFFGLFDGRTADKHGWLEMLD